MPGAVAFKKQPVDGPACEAESWPFVTVPLAVGTKETGAAAEARLDLFVDDCKNLNSLMRGWQH
jgi:hypothetical protein